MGKIEQVMMRFSITFFASAFALAAAFAQQPAPEAPDAGSRERSQKLSQEEAMPESDGSRLGDILERYYAQGLGGFEQWSELESLRLTGTMKVPDGELSLRAVKKRPEYLKLSLEGPSRSLQLAYDGRRGWKAEPDEPGTARRMGTEAERTFRLQATFGSLLVFPGATGKTIEYVDTVPLNGDVSHHLRVTLESQFVVHYYVGVRDYLEHKIVFEDRKTGTKKTTVLEDYTRVKGVPVARTVKTWRDGKFVSELSVDRIEANIGVMPWMFEMPKPTGESDA